MAQERLRAYPDLVMKRSIHLQSRLPASGSGRRLFLAALTLWVALLSPTRADDTSNEKSIDRSGFTLKVPANWHEDTKAPDYKADTNFTLDSAKQSYMQFNIAPKAPDLDKALADATFNFDGLAITTLSKSPVDQWGHYQGKGVHLMGKILDTSPGGIKVFTFNTDKYNILVVEFYYSDELQDVQGEMKFISDNFVVKD
jgi:hypothetical protein